MTSNVIALPGVGHSPQAPVRPVPAAANDQDQPRRYDTARNDAHGHAGEAKKANPARPQSPVDLNTLLAAQEHGSAEESANAKQDSPQPGPQLTEAEQKHVAELKKNDAEIRRHEQAHAAAGGQYAGSPQYEYTDGPDGKRYATAGHVSIDVTPIPGDPKATIEKMDVVRRAANAPAEPSAADRSVAAKAAAQKQTAQAELSQQKAEELANANGAEDSDQETGFIEGFAFGDSASAGEAKNGTTGVEDKPAAPSVGVSPAAAAAAYAAAPLNSLSGA